MNLHLYKTTDPPKKVDKKLTNEVLYENIRFINPIDTSIPTVIIDRTGYEGVGDISNYNYMHIPSLHRYYFITSIKVQGNKIHISGKCDVLYTYRKSILASTQLIKRSESLKNKMLSDDMLPIHADNTYTLKEFGESVTSEQDYRIVLQTNGHVS